MGYRQVFGTAFGGEEIDCAGYPRGREKQATEEGEEERGETGGKKKGKATNAYEYIHRSPGRGFHHLKVRQGGNKGGVARRKRDVPIKIQKQGRVPGEGRL